MGKKMKKGCQDLEAQLLDLRDLAQDHKLTVEVRRVSCNRNKDTLHVMFNDGARHVLHYWPGNGRIWAPATNEKMKVRDCWEALDEAARIAAEQVVG